MRTGLILAPLVLIAAPLSAQPAPQEVRQMQQILADPSIGDRMTDIMQGLSTVILSLPIGDVEAAADGRKPTAADHRRTVGSESGMDERRLHANIAATRPMLQQSMKALSAALPAMMQSFAQAQQALERAAANMPDPNYPKR